MKSLLHRLSRDHLLLAVLLIFATLRGLVWIGSYPALKIADEPSHFDNIQYRAEHRLSAPAADGSKILKVINPTYSPELKFAWASTDKYWRTRFLHGRRSVPEERELDDLAKTAAQRKTTGQSSSIEYPGVYYTLGALAYDAFWHSSVVTRLFAVRVYSMSWSLLLVACTFLCLVWSVESRPLAIAGSLFVALQPMAAQQLMAVNNDAGVIGLCSLVFLLQLKIVRDLPQVPRWPMMTVLGVMMALSVQTKPQAYGLFPGFLFLAAWLLVRHRSRATTTAVISLIAGFGVAYLLAGLLGGHSGAPAATAILAHPAVRTIQTPPDAPHSLLDFPKWLISIDSSFVDYLFTSAWGSFCWLDVSLSAVWFDVLHYAALLFWLGAAAAITRRLVTPDDDFEWKLYPVSFAAGTALVGTVFVLFLEFFARTKMNIDHAIQGRAFLFLLPAFAVVGIVALSSLVPRRFHALAAALFATGVVTLAFGSLLTVIGYQYVG